MDICVNISSPESVSQSFIILAEFCVVAASKLQTFWQGFLHQCLTPVQTITYPHTIIHPYVRHSDTLSNVLFTKEIILNEINNLPVNSAPGPDGLTSKTIKLCSQNLIGPLCKIFQTSLTSGKLPTQWLEAVVTPIFKKGDKCKAENYRPISLTSSTCKLFEKVLVRQLLEFLRNKNVVPISQHGFIPGRSAITNLLTSCNQWTKLLDTGKTVDIAYLDFSKAFDRVPHSLLLHKLERYGINGHVLNWIAAFLSSRTFAVCHGSNILFRSFFVFLNLAGVEGPWVLLMLGDAPSLLEHLESNLKSNEFSKLSLTVRPRVID
jgi:hypothetical protein